MFDIQKDNNDYISFQFYEKLLKKNEIIPFSYLIKYQKQYYFQYCNTNIKKKNLLKHFIIDSEVNNDYLDYYLNHILLQNNNEKNKNEFSEIYNKLKFSLSKNQKEKYFFYLNEKMKSNKNEQLFVQEDPKFLIANFIDFFCNKFKETKSKEIILKEIDEKINNYNEIYQVNILNFNWGLGPIPNPQSPIPNPHKNN